MPAVATRPASERPAERGVTLPASLITLDDTQSEGSARTWIQVLRTGKFWSSRYGEFSVTKATLAKMLANYQKYTPKSPTELPIDFNHGTSEDEKTVEQGMAAGWIKAIELRNEGAELWADVEFTSDAADLIREKKYRYVSATFAFDYKVSEGEDRKKAIGPTLMAAALTNTPFVEGMAPIVLGRNAAFALAEEEAGEAAFSYDDQRMRVQCALTDRFGYGSPEPCGVNPWIVDLYDGQVVYCGPSGKRYRLAFTIGADGVVAFSGSAEEVRVTYQPLAATPALSRGVHAMPTIKVTDAAGHEVELTEEAVAALAKAHAPKPAGVDVAALDRLEAALTKTQTQVAELQTRNQELETEKRQTAAAGKVDALIRAGKIAPKKRDQYIKLAMDDRDTFAALTSDLPTIYQTGEIGSGAEGEGLSATQQAVQLARAEMTANPKISLGDALTAVLQRDGDLYRRYAAESAVRT